MGNHDARRQKQLAKKKAKRNDKRTQIARQTSKDPTIRLAGAEMWPIADVLVSDKIWESGIGTVIVARKAPGGGLACAVFLVDAWCLGVKTAFWKLMSSFEYQDLAARIKNNEPLRSQSPEYAVKLLVGAVAYARSLGFSPDADYRHARLLLAGIDPSLCTETFTFGKDGKPLYVRGPKESIAQAQSIGRRVTDLGGDFIVMLDESTSPDDFDQLENSKSDLRLDHSS